MTKIYMTYFAALRDDAGLSEESINTEAVTARDLYAELQTRFRWKLMPEDIMVAADDAYVDMDYTLQEGDKIVFIPPVAGG